MSAHWTTDPDDFRFSVAYDFVLQLEGALERKEWSQARLASELGVSESRISQVINNPGNLTLGLIVKCARAVGEKITIVMYDDGDAQSARGPVDSSVFRKCWIGMKMPLDNWAFEHNVVTTPPQIERYSDAWLSTPGRVSNRAVARGAELMRGIDVTAERGGYAHA